MDWFDRFFRSIWPRPTAGEEDRMADMKRAEAWVDAQLKPSCAPNYMHEPAKQIVMRMAHGVIVSQACVNIETAVHLVWRSLEQAAYEPTAIVELLFQVQRCNVPYDSDPLQFLRWVTVEAGNIRAELAASEGIAHLHDPEVPRLLIERMENGAILHLFALPESS